jgi:pimeloyl-ACP methyl ester carboxylesterase
MACRDPPWRNRAAHVSGMSACSRRRGPVLLVMGVANDALGWPQPFLDALVDAGYKVIRHDHRGTDLSDWEAGADYAAVGLIVDQWRPAARLSREAARECALREAAVSGICCNHRLAL